MVLQSKKQQQRRFPSIVSSGGDNGGGGDDDSNITEITEDEESIADDMQTFFQRQWELERKEDAFYENELYNTLTGTTRRSDGGNYWMKSALLQKQRPDSPRPTTKTVGWPKKPKILSHLGHKKRMPLLSKNLRLLRQNYEDSSSLGETSVDTQEYDILKETCSKSIKKCQKRLLSLSWILLIVLALVGLALYVESINCSVYLMAGGHSLKMLCASGIFAGQSAVPRHLLLRVPTGDLSKNN